MFLVDPPLMVFAIRWIRGLKSIDLVSLSGLVVRAVIKRVGGSWSSREGRWCGGLMLRVGGGQAMYLIDPPLIISAIIQVCKV